MKPLALTLLCLLAALPALAQSTEEVAFVEARDFFFFPGQLPVDSSGRTPSDFDAQARLVLSNLQTKADLAGVSLRHMVWVQVYLEDINQWPRFEDIARELFAGQLPALAPLGIAAVGSKQATVAVDAVAYRTLAGIERTPGSAAVSAGGLTFLSAAQGRDLSTGRIPETHAEQTRIGLENLGVELQGAGLGFEHMVFMHPYLLPAMAYGDMNKVYATFFEFGATPARATIFVDALPHDLTIEFTGVAVRDLSKRQPVRPKNMAPSPTASPCVWGGDFYFCSGKSGFIPGVEGGVWAESVENQFRQTMRNLLDNLEETGLDFSDVVSTQLYLDDIADLERVDPIYQRYFPKIKPTRTVVQQLPSGSRKQAANGRWPAIEQMALVAVRR
ncbi:MAG: hypothetical protein GC160_22555 [Acidobacteria bacterium]|nr:hypothetical protein [Acidobacteriota bacterium]